MKFSYIAKDENGKEVRGAIESSSKLEAADKLYNEKGLNVVSLEKVEETKGELEAKAKAAKTESDPIKKTLNAIDNFLIDQTKITPRDKAVFFRLLAVMINAGLPIVKSLQTLAGQLENKRLQKILGEISTSVEEGKNFSSCLKEYRDIFADSEIGIIESGEASGQLNKTLQNLAAETEKSASLKAKIKGAMIYPAVVITIMIAAIVLVMVMVVPKLGELFESGGVELPLATRILMGTSNWFTSTWFIIPNWMLFILSVVGLVVGLGAWKKTPSGKLIWDKLMLEAPLFGELIKKSCLAGFARQLSLLSESGVSIIKALEITANAVGNEVYKNRLLEVKEEVENGDLIHQVIEGDKLFPNLVVSMIAVGEQTAQLGSVSEKIAIFYEEEVDTFVANLSKVMEPAIMVGIGLGVGGLVAAIMQPIMQLSDVAANA